LKKQLFKDERPPFVLEIDEETDVDITAAIRDFESPIGFDFVNLPLVPGGRFIPTGNGRMITLFKRVKLGGRGNKSLGTMGEHLNQLFKHEYLRLCFAVREMPQCQVTSVTHSLNILEDDVVELLVAAMVHRVVPPSQELFMRTRSAYLADSSTNTSCEPLRMWSVAAGLYQEDGSFSARIPSATPTALKSRLYSIAENSSNASGGIAAIGIAEPELQLELATSSKESGNSTTNPAESGHVDAAVVEPHMGLSVSIPDAGPSGVDSLAAPSSSEKGMSSCEKGGWTPRGDEREAAFERERYEALMDLSDRKYAKQRLGTGYGDFHSEEEDGATFKTVDSDTPLEELYHETGFFANLRKHTRSISQTTGEVFGATPVTSQNSGRHYSSSSPFDSGVKAPPSAIGSGSGLPTVPVAVVEAYNSSVRQHLATHSGGAAVPVADYNRQECASEVALTAHMELPDAM